MQNFLLTSKGPEGELKLTDFGLGVFFKNGERFKDLVGSPYYVAPEVHMHGGRGGGSHFGGSLEVLCLPTALPAVDMGHGCEGLPSHDADMRVPTLCACSAVGRGR